MSQANEIKRLLDRGNYLEASRLADKHKITDCRNFCQKLPAINEIANSIDNSVSVVSALSDKIISYESELRNIKDTAFQMTEKENAVEKQNENIRKICDTIEKLLQGLSIPDCGPIFNPNNYYDRNSVLEVEEILEEFEQTLNYEVDPHLLEMKCVRDKRAHAREIKEKFSEQLSGLFYNKCVESLSTHSESFINHIYSTFTLPSHNIIYDQLEILQPLVQWTWRNDLTKNREMDENYVQESRVQYVKEFNVFFECAKERMSYSRKRNSLNAGEDYATRASSLSGGAGGTMDSQDTASSKSSEISYSCWDEFDTDIERMLLALDKHCWSEQQFYMNFFSPLEEDSNEKLENLVIMFGDLKREFIEFAKYYNTLNGLYSLYLLNRLSQYLSIQNSTDKALLKIYGEVTINVKRNFDEFMEQKLRFIRELKAPKQPKCGVLSAVKNFEQFAKQVERLFERTKTRTNEVDRRYPELVNELFRTIERMEHSRTPTEMIRLENYNYLYDVLMQMKVPCLNTKPKEAKEQYEIALRAYVKRYFGRPLEKVNIFFDGVQAKINQGVKEDEISFQLAFSKQELRKVLQMVTLKEVRKGLEEMYRRIEKHAYEPKSYLIQVIWHAMQTEFLTQYKAIQGMIERCYPSSNLGLTFTIEDVLQVFSDIAQSH